MEAVIKKIKLKNILNRYYFSLEIQSVEGKVYHVDKPLLSDPISFRKQVFGIMAACNQFDLLRLSSDNPIYKEVIGYYSNGLQIIENNKNEWFSYNIKTSSYFCDQSSQSVKELFSMAVNKKIPDVSVNKGRIESISSGSGVLQIFFKSNGLGTFMNTGQVYYGFGYPIGIGSIEDKEIINSASLSFQSFILSIMNFYGVDDLLKLSGNIDKYPIVDITVYKNKIKSITSFETGMGISIGKSYEIINVFEPEKVKMFK